MDLSDWIGDISDFEINSEGQLQLNAPDAGPSTIYLENTFSDSTIWSLDVELDFSPSGANNLEILLAVDNPDLAIANGYVLQLGENGSEDAITLLQYDNGSSLTLASGNMGKIASAFNLNLELVYDSNDNWILRTRSIGSLLSEPEFEFNFQATPSLDQLNLFGFKCNYTNTRSDKFFFDNLFVDVLLSDTDAPQFLDAKIINPNTIEIAFDEVINPNSLSTNNFLLDNGLEVINATLDNSRPNTVILILNQDIPSGTTINLDVSNLSDNAGNIIDGVSVSLNLLESPTLGDLILTEILFDPITLAEDFVEIHNKSDKFLNLNGLIISNADKDEEDIIDEDIELLPGEYLAITPNANQLIDIYQPPADALIFENEIPSFNNSDGNVTISIIEESELTELDAFDYEEDYHSTLVADTEGISLERISVDSPTNNSENWTSSAQLNNFATPGYKNSNTTNPNIDSQEAINLEYKTFTPNQDGDKDLLIINYNIDNTGFVGTFNIYNDRGYKKRTLITNQSLGSQGIISWDGTDDQSQLLPIGIYIIVYELFDANGNTMSGKLVSVLGDNLN